MEFRKNPLQSGGGGHLPVAMLLEQFIVQELKGFFIFFVSLFLGGAFVHAEPAPKALAAYVVTLKNKFPGVSTITPSQLAALDVQPVLLDVRDPGEFAVSHISGAVRAEKDVIAQLNQLGVKHDDLIVVYCSVGYRSSVLAEELKKAGYANVQNLEGSLFAWANEGRPLVNARGPTEGAHPFNLVWGRFLEKSKWRWSETKP